MKFFKLPHFNEYGGECKARDALIGLRTRIFDFRSILTKVRQFGSLEFYEGAR